MRTEDFHPVAAAVGGIEALIAGERVVPPDRVPELSQPVREGGDVVDQERGVGLAGRTKPGLDADVQLASGPPNHTPPRAASAGGFAVSGMPSRRP